MPHIRVGTVCAESSLVLVSAVGSAIEKRQAVLGSQGTFCHISFREIGASQRGGGDGCCSGSETGTGAVALHMVMDGASLDFGSDGEEPVAATAACVATEKVTRACFLDACSDEVGDSCC